MCVTGLLLSSSWQLMLPAAHVGSLPQAGQVAMCHQLCHVLCPSQVQRTEHPITKRPNDSNGTCHQCMQATLQLLQHCSCNDSDALLLASFLENS